MRDQIQLVSSMLHEENPVKPNLNRKTFVVENYSHLRSIGEYVYTDVFKVDGFEWRLKIYPNGLGKNDSQNKKL